MITIFLIHVTTAGSRIVRLRISVFLSSPPPVLRKGRGRREEVRQEGDHVHDSRVSSVLLGRPYGRPGKGPAWGERSTENPTGCELGGGVRRTYSRLGGFYETSPTYLVCRRRTQEGAVGSPFGPLGNGHTQVLPVTSSSFRYRRHLPTRGTPCPLDPIRSTYLEPGPSSSRPRDRRILPRLRTEELLGPFGRGSVRCPSPPFSPGRPRNTGRVNVGEKTYFPACFPGSLHRCDESGSLRGPLAESDRRVSP